MNKIDYQLLSPNVRKKNNTDNQTENAETEVTKEEEESNNVFKGIEEETGLAILIRYKKSF